MANVTDTFNRANSNAGLGTASDGTVWISRGGFWGITSNTAYLDGSSGNNIQVVQTSESDGYVQLTIPTFSGGGTSTIACNLILRYGDDNNYIRIQCEGDAFVMYKFIGGSETNVSFRLCTITAGSVVKATMSGTTFALYLDGVKQGADFTISDVALDTNTKHGFSTTNLLARFDDFMFVGSGGGGGGSTAPVKMHHMRQQGMA